MPINPEIALQVRPPADPLQQYGKALAIRNELAQGPLRAEQLKAAQLSNQQGQRALDQTDALNKAYSDALSVGPDGKPSIDTGGLTTALATGGHGAAIPGIMKGLADSQEAVAKLAKTRGEVKGQEADAAGAIGATLKQANGDPRLFLTLAQHAVDSGAVDQGLIAPLIQHVQQGLQTDPTGESVRGDVNKFADQFIASSPKHTELQTARLREESTAKKNDVETANLKQTGAIKERQDAAAILGTATDQKDYAQKYGDLPVRVALQFQRPETFDPATSPGQIRALGMSSEQQTLAAATAARDTSTKTYQDARLKMEKSRTDIAQHIYDQTYGENANEALKGVEPKLRVQATQAAQKAANEYQAADRVAGDMQSLIDMTRSGNKAAGSNLPLVGVETINALNGIKRINRTEVDVYQGAGSLLDRIQGKIDKLVVGQPIPADVMADIEKMHNILRENGEKGYNDKLAGINQNYHSNFKPVPSGRKPAANQPNGGGAHKVGDVVSIGGKKVKITAIDKDGTFDGDEVK